MPYMASCQLKLYEMYSDYELDCEEMKVSILLNKLVIAYDIEPQLVSNPESEYSNAIEEISMKILEFGLKRLDNEKIRNRVLSVNNIIIKSYWIKFYNDFNDKITSSYFIVGEQEMIDNYVLDWVLIYKNELFMLYEYIRIKGIS